MIDIDKVVHSLSTKDIIEIMESLGCDDYIDQDKALIFRTACHHVNQEDGSYKLYYYKKDKVFTCYTGCGTFNIIGFIQKRYELLNIEYDFYKDILLPLAERANVSAIATQKSFIDSYDLVVDKYRKKQIQVNMPSLDPAILNTYTFYPTKEWLEDGISEEAMRLYQIRYSIKENKIIIPHYDVEGKLIGIRGRALNEEDLIYGKYMPISLGDTILKHPLGYNLYGLNMIQGNIKRLNMAIIAESEKAVLQYDTMFGHHNNIVVATCGSSLHDYQINLLIHAGASKILLAYDKEGETEEERKKYYLKLRKICETYQNKVQMGFIWDMENLLDLKDSPTDKGKEVFLRLYQKNTVWI